MLDDEKMAKFGEGNSAMRSRGEVASNDSRQKRDRSSCIKRGCNRRFATRSLRAGLVLIRVAFSQDHPVSARRICPRTRGPLPTRIFIQPLSPNLAPITQSNYARARPPRWIASEKVQWGRTNPLTTRKFNSRKFLRMSNRQLIV